MAAPVAAETELIHGTAVALDGRAVLFCGPPGAGKSDLALRCLGLGTGGLIPGRFEFVADDQVQAAARDGRVIVSAPPAIRGLMEVRGIGIAAVATVEQAELALIVQLAPGHGPDRMPDALAPAVIAGMEVRRIELDPREPSAPLKVALALMGTVRPGA